MVDAITYRVTLNNARWRRPGLAAFLLGFGIFGLLWIIGYVSYHEVYAPSSFDVPVLADGLLLAPHAHWTDWFTRGYSDFWDLYPEWGSLRTAFARPTFQSLIYIAHFALGRDWVLYIVISCFAAAGVTALAFHIAQTALGLRTEPSLLAAVLVLLSPPVLTAWLEGFAFAVEPLATVFVASAFLAVIARRDVICLIFLFLALLTKENAVWAPLAAAITVALRPKLDESPLHQAFAATGMLVPIVMWVGLRFAFFGGFGGTYATAGYTPLADFLQLTLVKLMHLQHLFLTAYINERHWALNLAVGIVTAFLIYALLFLCALHVLPKTMQSLCHAMQSKRWPAIGGTSLVTLWAVMALGFHFALPLSEQRYATSVVVFAWPALIAEVERRRNVVIWLGVALCFIASLSLGSYLSADWINRNVVKYLNYRSMEAVLRSAPAGTQQLYVLSASGLQATNPKYVGLILGLAPEIVRVVDIDWNCGESNHVVAFDHRTVDGVIDMSVTLPACASFRISFGASQLDGTALATGHLFRSDTMSYEITEAYSIKHNKVWGPALYLGRKLIIHIRPNGPARFVIEHGRPNGIAWFDTH